MPDSYQAERRPLAQLLLGLTSLIYVGESSPNPVVGLLRGQAPPLVAPIARGFTPLTRLILRILGQLAYHYPAGVPVREGEPRSGHGPRAGHRLPDTRLEIDGRWTTAHQVLSTPGLHLLLSGAAAAERRLRPLHERYGDLLRVHHAATPPDGRPETGYHLVRPDGYVGLRGAGDDLAQIADFLSGWR